METPQAHRQVTPEAKQSLLSMQNTMGTDTTFAAHFPAR